MTNESVNAILGRSVVGADDALELGEVKAVVLDRAASTVQRLQVAGSKRSPEMVEWDDIENLGADAIMVRSSDSVHDSDDDADADYVRGDIEIIGARVLDTAGYAIGTVEDVTFDAASGAVIAAQTDQGTIPSDRIRSLGTYALVVDVA